jgi:hypothetical protein
LLNPDTKSIYFRMKRFKSLLLWIFAIIFTLFIAAYQRTTGPTYPKNAEVSLNNRELKFKLIRTHSDGDAQINLFTPSRVIKGKLTYKRYKSFDPWTTVDMVRVDDNLIASLPHQPPAGKIEYMISLSADKEYVNLTPEPVVLRFTGEVPLLVLIPHILIMFLAMLFSSRTGIEAFIKGSRTYTYTIWTIILLFVGGLILGPIVQYYAFGAFWTGWPFGGDLTDNKTFVAFIFWVIAFFVLRKHPENRLWPILASIVMLLVYLIPHSMFGSEIDHTKVPEI